MKFQHATSIMHRGIQKFAWHYYCVLCNVYVFVRSTLICDLFARFYGDFMCRYAASKFEFDYGDDDVASIILTFNIFCCVIPTLFVRSVL
jgi:hypothetical protein